MNLRRTSRRFAGWLPVLLLLAAPALAENNPDAVSRFYKVHYLRPAMVEILAKQACGGSFYHPLCKMSFGSDGYVEFTATEEQQEQFSAALEDRDVPPATQIFQVHLLRATTKGNAMPPLPMDAVHALEDLRQLLPFQGYELVDSGFMRTSGEAQLYMGSDRRYEAHLRFEGDPSSGKPLKIDFSLRAERTVDDDGEQVVVGEVRLMGTTFSMKVGETVVVGTSKLNGGSEALVVLLSAGQSDR